MEANWIGLVLVVLGLYLAFKLIGVVFNLLMWLVVLVGAYWFLAPMLGWPTVSDLVYVFGPDFGGQRIEEVFTPARVADDIGGRVADGVAEGVAERLQMPELPEPLRPEAPPEQVPEGQPDAGPVEPDEAAADRSGPLQ